MPLTTNQIELIKQIQSGLQRGDISKIAEETGLSRLWVSKSLNTDAEHFNEKVAEAAVKVIAARDKNAAALLQRIPQ